ncbi:hypothetical protein Bca4012_082017 [Brassica carinata]
MVTSSALGPKHLHQNGASLDMTVVTMHSNASLQSRKDGSDPDRRRTPAEPRAAAEKRSPEIYKTGNQIWRRTSTLKADLFRIHRTLDSPLLQIGCRHLLWS